MTTERERVLAEVAAALGGAVGRVVGADEVGALYGREGAETGASQLRAGAVATLPPATVTSSPEERGQRRGVLLGLLGGAVSDDPLELLGWGGMVNGRVVVKVVVGGGAEVADAGRKGCDPDG